LSSFDNPQVEPQPLVNVTPDTASVTPDASYGPSADPAVQTPPPVEDPVWNWWDLLQIAGVAVLSVVAFQILLIVGAKVFVYPHTSFKVVAQKVTLAILGQFLAYILAAAFMILLVEGKHQARFWPAIRWNWPANSAKFLGIGVLTVGLDFLARFLPMPKNTPFEQFFERPLDAYLISIFAVTLGPLMEELFFRGFLYPLLARRLGAVAGVVLTSLPFGLIHYVQYGSAWSAVLVIAMVGVVLTTVRAVTKSVASSFLVHVGYNGTLMLLLAVSTDGFRHMEKAGLLIF
jgi:membrane protease YdiL (CAAX protease family)